MYIRMARIWAVHGIGFFPLPPFLLLPRVKRCVRWPRHASTIFLAQTRGVTSVFVGSELRLEFHAYTTWSAAIPRDTTVLVPLGMRKFVSFYACYITNGPESPFDEDDGRPPSLDADTLPLQTTP